MKVYCVFEFFLGDEEFLGAAKTYNGALAILKRKCPDDIREIENGKFTLADANNNRMDYLFEIQEVEVEE